MKNTGGQGLAVAALASCLLLVSSVGGSSLTIILPEVQRQALDGQYLRRHLHSLHVPICVN